MEKESKMTQTTCCALSTIPFTIQYSLPWSILPSLNSQTVHTANATCEIEQLIKCRIFKSFNGKFEKQQFKNLCLFDVVTLYHADIVSFCWLEWERFHSFYEIQFVAKRQNRTVCHFRSIETIAMHETVSRLYRVFHVNFSISARLWCSFVKHWKQQVQHNALTLVGMLSVRTSSRPLHSSIFISLCSILTLSHVCLFRLFVCLFLYDLIRSLMEHTEFNSEKWEDTTCVNLLESIKTDCRKSNNSMKQLQKKHRHTHTNKRTIESNL